MPPLRKEFPTYRKHSSGQARVTLTDPDGRSEDVLLGEYGSKESRRRYDDELAAWIARGRTLPKTHAEDEPISVNEVCLAYLKHKATVWTGERKRHYESLKRVVEMIHVLYGLEPASSFGPRKLKQIRQQMIDVKKWSRTYINKQTNLVRKMFRWASEEEMVTPTVWHGLLAIENLKMNTPGVREGKKVRPADPAIVEKTIPFLSPLLQVVARLQRITGARGGEILAMRMIDIEIVKPNLWRYFPASHKTEHHGHRRVIRLGERCIELLAPVIEGIEESEYVFSPKRSEELRSQARAKNRKTPMYASHAKRNAAIKAKADKRKRAPKKRYAKATYSRAVQRACKLAGVAPWNPHMLRHLVGKEMRPKYGLDATRALLGHRGIQMTDHYSEIDTGLAERIAIECC